MALLEAFERLHAKFDAVFLLESLEQNERISRYSIMGFEPRHRISANNYHFTVDGETALIDDPYAELRRLMGTARLPNVGFCGGLVGYFSYEATRYFEPTVPFKTTEFPDFEFGMYFDGLVFNKLTGETYYFYLDEDRSDLILEAIREPAHEEPLHVRYFGSNVSPDEHKAMFDRAKEHILAGNSYQIQYSRKFNYELCGSRLGIYRQLRRVNPSPHMFYLKFGEREIIGSSPEIVVRMERGLVEIIPIAGTTKRGATPEEDRMLGAAMLNDEKEVAEHMMLVDLARNDVGRLCTFHTVQVRRLMYILRFSHVQHIVSDVEGQLAPGKDMFDVYAVSTPAGTVTGAPKIESMKIISELEREGRGPYAGSVGYFSFSGDCYFAIAIRSLFCNGDRAYGQAASGIVFDSTADYEYQEIENKGAAMRRAIQLAEVAG
jgi:anthranilate synthase component 1